MAGFLDRYTGRGGRSFRVDKEGYRIDDSGKRARFALGADSPYVKRFGIAPGSYQQRIGPKGKVYFGGNVGGYVGEGGYLVNDLPKPPTPSPENPIVKTSENFGVESKNVLEAAPRTPATRLQAPPREALRGKDAPRVSTELTGLLERSNPYIDQARARSLRFANRRGLVNTSLAAQAGEEAAISAALPIAQQDAGHLQSMNLATQQSDEALRRAYEGQYLQKDLTGYQGDERLRTAAGQEILARGGAQFGADLERGLITARTDETIRGERAITENQLRINAQTQANVLERLDAEQANVRERLDLQQADILERIDAEQSYLLNRIDAEQSNLLERLRIEHRYGLEDTVIKGAQTIQKMVIEEMAAINRTQGLTQEQQKSAIADVQRRADAHIKYLRAIAASAPDWDTMFDEVPSLEVESTAKATETAPTEPPAKSSPAPNERGGR